MRSGWQRSSRNPRIIVRMLTLAALFAGGAAVSRGVTAATEDPVCAQVKKLQGPARQEVLAFARIMAIRPSMAIDFSKTSGEYCFDTGGHVMAHFSAKPEETGEDVVFFVDAAPLVAKGLKLDQVPPMDPALGKMQPNTWYRYEGKGSEPHHGMEMAGRTWLILGVDVR